LGHSNAWLVEWPDPFDNP